MDEIDRIGNKPEVKNKPVTEQKLGKASVTRQNRNQRNEQEIDRQIIGGQNGNRNHRSQGGDQERILSVGRKPVERVRIAERRQPKGEPRNGTQQREKRIVRDDIQRAA